MLPSLLPSVIYQPSSLSPLSPLFRLILQPLQLTKKGRFKRLIHPSPPGFFSLFRSKKRTTIVFNYLFFSLYTRSEFPLLFPDLSFKIGYSSYFLFKDFSLFFTIYYPLSLMVTFLLTGLYSSLSSLSLLEAIKNQREACSIQFPATFLSLSRVHSYYASLLSQFISFCFLLPAIKNHTRVSTQIKKRQSLSLFLSSLSLSLLTILFFLHYLFHSNLQ